VCNCQVESTATRMLMLQLTDGAVEVQGMEYRPIPALSASLTSGTKVTPLKMTDSATVIIDMIVIISIAYESSVMTLLSSVVTVAGICNFVSGGVFLTCHRGASGSGEYWSVSKLGLLIDIRIAASRWPFLLYFKLGHVVHLSRYDMLPGLYGHTVCTMHCRSICPVPFPSDLITTHTSTTTAIVNKSTDRTGSPRYKITLPLLSYS